jgi:hypothetical protein
MLVLLVRGLSLLASVRWVRQMSHDSGLGKGTVNDPVIGQLASSLKSKP